MMRFWNSIRIAIPPGIDLFSIRHFIAPDDSLPPGIESDDFDSENDDNYTFTPEFESFHVDYPDLGDSTIDAVEDIPYSYLCLNNCAKARNSPSHHIEAVKLPSVFHHKQHDVEFPADNIPILGVRQFHLSSLKKHSVDVLVMILDELDESIGWRAGTLLLRRDVGTDDLEILGMMVFDVIRAPLTLSDKLADRGGL
ncbi:hypothetical protein Tco_1408569 [Tanacetum coccineum]